MASQLRRTTGNRRLTSDPHAILQAKIAALPQTLANQQQQALIKRDTQFQNKQIALQKGQMRQQKREQQAAMGLEAGKLGLNMASSDLAGKSVGELYKGAKSTFMPSAAGEATKTGGLYDITPGGALAGGLAGYGVGQLLGGKNKAKKALFGGLAGGLVGLLGGGGNLFTAGAGAGLGALGGLF